jgi:Ni/Co efflux regulator RcnB
MKARKWIVLCGALLLALAGGPVLAQGKSQGHGRGHDPDREEHKKFDDHDRNSMRDWYRDHRGHPPKGFRDRDRLSDEFERRLTIGFVLTPDYRRRVVSVPGDLYRRFPPPPRGYRYVVIGGHICLVDRDWRVADVVHFELDFHF